MVDEEHKAGPEAMPSVGFGVDPERPKIHKAAGAFRTISEVADELHVPQHVLRFWESKFPQVRPLKRGGGRRYYRPEDVMLLRRVADLLYIQGYTIKGVQRLLRDNLESVSLPYARGRAKQEVVLPEQLEHDLTPELDSDLELAPNTEETDYEALPGVLGATRLDELKEPESTLQAEPTGSVEPAPNLEPEPIVLTQDGSALELQPVLVAEAQLVASVQSESAVSDSSIEPMVSGLAEAQILRTTLSEALSILENLRQILA